METVTWQPIETAPKDGTQCILKFRDVFGEYALKKAFFLHDDGNWYLINPPTKILKKPTHWMPLPKGPE